MIMIILENAFGIVSWTHNFVPDRKGMSFTEMRSLQATMQTIVPENYIWLTLINTQLSYPNNSRDLRV